MLLTSLPLSEKQEEKENERGDEMLIDVRIRQNESGTYDAYVEFIDGGDCTSHQVAWSERSPDDARTVAEQLLVDAVRSDPSNYR